MVEEKVYKLENGENKILMSQIKIQDRKYVLLSDENTEETEVAYEENGNLNFIEKTNENYRYIFEQLYQKFLEQNQINI